MPKYPWQDKIESNVIAPIRQANTVAVVAVTIALIALLVSLMAVKRGK